MYQYTLSLCIVLVRTNNCSQNILSIYSLFFFLSACYLCVVYGTERTANEKCARTLGCVTSVAANEMRTTRFGSMKRDEKVLLVFPKNDVVCGALNDACSRLEMDTFMSQTAHDTIDLFQNAATGGHNLIIVDGRAPSVLDPETVAR